MYRVDENGKWKVEGNIEMLIEPSESFLANIELERQKEEDKKLIENLIPTEKEILMAEIELNTITLLQEVGLI